MVSSPDNWDRYEGLQWYAAAKYARSNPGDPDLPEQMERVNRSRECYLRWGRDCLGWDGIPFPQTFLSNLLSPGRPGRGTVP